MSLRQVEGEPELRLYCSLYQDTGLTVTTAVTALLVEVARCSTHLYNFNGMGGTVCTSSLGLLLILIFSVL